MYTYRFDAPGLCLGLDNHPHVVFDGGYSLLQLVGYGQGDVGQGACRLLKLNKIIHRNKGCTYISMYINIQKYRVNKDRNVESLSGCNDSESVRKNSPITKHGFVLFYCTFLESIIGFGEQMNMYHHIILPLRVY